MSQATPATPQGWALPFSNPVAFTSAAIDYLVDAWQRSVLYADVRRERGNQYKRHLHEETPNVLDFPWELLISGKSLPRPVNYQLMRIVPDDGQAIDPTKRPIIVVDPRAGHGPGIGGFKPDSEIGAALKAGHPCYFIGFLPDPILGQSVEDVMRAEAEFVRHVASLHPSSPGKPAVIGNCQAGWQIMMAAAVWPELFGPIIVAGAPLSYWAGNTPMRYTGGLCGGSWLTALTSDLGAGRFDGAWLVKNFENLNPANTLWSKQYHLYEKVDTEAERYLGFEKYWGGHVFLNDVEMQYIVDNLFIGNRLATAELMTSEGTRIDLRNIQSPVVVFCSYGDNITPPGQALGWITDLYRNDEDIIGHDQTIVYATHASIGHLGIFVSGAVGRREHREFISNIDLIDVLPAGVYHASVEDRPEGVPLDELTDDEYLMSIRRSSVDDVREIVAPDADSERRFDTAARVSEINLALYRNLMQHWVQAMSTPLTARWLQALHPLRVGYEFWSDENPMAGGLAESAQRVREDRRPVARDNPFWLMQQHASDMIEHVLDTYRDRRDAIFAIVFDTLYGLPWLQAVAGHAIADTRPVRMHPGDSPEHQAYLVHELKQLESEIGRGGLPEAAVRAVFHVLSARGEADERHFRYIAQVLESRGTDIATFRQLLRRQAMILQRDAKAAIAAIPQLLAGADAESIERMSGFVESLVHRTDDLSADEQRRLDEVLGYFRDAMPKPRATASRSAPAPAPAAEVGSAVEKADEVPADVDDVMPPIESPRPPNTTRGVTPRRSVPKRVSAPPARKAPAKPKPSKVAKKVAKPEVAVTKPIKATATKARKGTEPVKRASTKRTGKTPGSRKKT